MGEVVTHNLRTIDPNSGVYVELLDYPLLVAMWPEVSGALRSMPHMLLNDTPESLLLKAQAQHIQVWGVGRPPRVEMFIITQISEHPARRVLEITMCFGPEVLELVGPAVDAALDNFAAHEGCSYIEVFGRPGWERILKPWGFEKRSVVLSRQVKNRRMN